MFVVKTIRNNWKKSLFGLGCGVYGLHFLNKKQEEWKLMKKYCLYAKEECEKNSFSGKKIVVILNPAASKGNGRSKFLKYVSPLLNLAGFQVELITTLHEGHGKSLSGELEKGDLILIAGGNGTVSEVLTGIMKSENLSLRRKPIGVVPLGKSNSLAKLLCNFKPSSEAEFISEMTLALVKGESLKFVDTFNVENEEGKSVYGVSSLSLGQFTDAENKKNGKSWRNTLIMNKLCYFISLVKGREIFEEIPLTFSEPCPGCVSCKKTTSGSTKPWWYRLFIRDSDPETPPITLVNPLCGKKNKIVKNFTQMDVFANRTTNSLSTLIIEEFLPAFSFIKMGWKRNKIEDETIPNWGKPLPLASSLNFKIHKKYNSSKIEIDKENYEIKSYLSINLCPNSFKFYFLPNKTNFSN